MADFALPKSIVAEVDEERRSKSHRRTFDDGTIRHLTDAARENGVSKAVSRYNRLHPDTPVGEQTVRDWLAVFKRTGQYHTVSKRGRPQALTAGEKTEVESALKKLRSAPVCEGLTASTVAAVSRGVVMRTRPAVLAKNDGPLHMGKRWAANVLKREDWKPLARTSDRTVPDDVVARAAPVFFDSLRIHKCEKSFVLNLDEFAVLLGSNKRWTWHEEARGWGCHSGMQRIVHVLRCYECSGSTVRVATHMEGVDRSCTCNI